MKKIGGRKKKEFFTKRVKKTLPYQLLIISLIILAILILIWVVLFILGQISYLPKDKGLEGELGTLIWDFGKQNITLEILNYNVSADNQTIEVNINWTSGVEDLRTILIDFEGVVECNYTNNSVPNFGVNQSYNIDYTQTSCNLNFENITSITNLSVYAQVNIPLTQTNLISNITLYNDDSGIDILDLDDYFTCLGDINFSSIEDPINDYTLLKINSTTNLITLIKGVTWYGVQKFNLTASCDGDVLNVLTNGKNMSFYLIAIDEDRVLVNNAPEFLNDWCEDLEWGENTNYSLDMDDCFEDEDGDDLDFRYKEGIGDGNLTIEIDSDDLTLIPDIDWFGSGYFYIYADDSTDETSGRVYFTVVENTTSTSSPITSTISTTTSDILKIKSSSPSNSTVNIFTNKTKKFFVTAQNYDSIKWYLDGELVLEGSLFYNFEKIDEGDYVIKVEIVNGTVTDSKIWNLVVQEEIKEDPFESGGVIFYLIVGIILIIIFLVLWLFIVEKNSRKTKINYMGFGVSKSS